MENWLKLGGIVVGQTREIRGKSGPKEIEKVIVKGIKFQEFESNFPLKYFYFCDEVPKRISFGEGGGELFNQVKVITYNTPKLILSTGELNFGYRVLKYMDEVDWKVFSV